MANVTTELVAKLVLAGIADRIRTVNAYRASERIGITVPEKLERKLVC